MASRKTVLPMHHGYDGSASAGLDDAAIEKGIPHVHGPSASPRDAGSRRARATRATAAAARTPDGAPPARRGPRPRPHAGAPRRRRRRAAARRATAAAAVSDARRRRQVERSPRSGGWRYAGPEPPHAPRDVERRHAARHGAAAWRAAAAGLRRRPTAPRLRARTRDSSRSAITAVSGSAIGSTGQASASQRSNSSYPSSRWTSQRDADRPGRELGKPLLAVARQRAVHRRQRAHPAGRPALRRQRGKARGVEPAAHHHRGGLAVAEPIVHGALQRVAEARGDVARAPHSRRGAEARSASRPRRPRRPMASR